MGEQSGHSWRGLLGESGGSEHLRGEGVAAVVQHELGTVVGYCCCLCIQLPPAEDVGNARSDLSNEILTWV